ncbi:MAG TPA: carbohydrate ABC transporter permease [Phototrophicaceae bacterium]|nr:carbohydrate ABC transporter permease [Phototrophicaceae bacterium]
MATTAVLPNSPFPIRRPWYREVLRWLSRDGFGALIAILLILVIIGPMLSVIFWAFATKWQYPALIPQTFGFRWWTETLKRADIAKAIPQSITITLIATVISTAVALPAAYSFARIRFPGRQIFLLSFLATNAFPRFGLYITIAVIFFKLNLIGTLPGVIVIEVVNSLLLMIWIPTAAFRGVDRSLEEAALDVGASRLRVFFQITLPLAFPAIIAAILLSAVGIFYESQAALIIGLPNVTTVPVLMYTLTNNELVVQYGAILMVITWVPSLIFLVFAQRFLRGRYFAAGFGV